MNRLLTTLVLFMLAVLVMNAQPRIVAHRGFWNTPGSAQNSIASLHKAAEEGFWGCEFDVQVSLDGIPLINHDPTIDGNRIEDHNYLEFRFHTLSNGEKLPSLRDYLGAAEAYPDIRLVLEIKSASTPEQETMAVEKILHAVESSKVEGQIEYITFSLHVLEEVLRMKPGAVVSYLNGDLSPAELKKTGASGIDYNLRVMKKNPDWFREAADHGMTVNVWTVNKEADMRWLIEQGADFITTDEPLLLRRILSEAE